jgi:hypothetical protein
MEKSSYLYITFEINMYNISLPTNQWRQTSIYTAADTMKGLELN